MAAPKGNRNGAHDKPWTRALERHAAQNPDKLARLAASTFDKALEGDMAAIREIGDRLDGKPAQSMELSGSLETGKTARELTDDDLASIAAGSGAGTACAPESQNQLN